MTGKDYPDWGGYPVSGQSYPLKDLAEAVVRLGSPVIYDRSGAVALLEDFSCGMGRWSVWHTGAGSNPVISSAFWCHGGHACHLDPGIVGGDGSVMQAYTPRLPVGLWGVSMRFSIHTWQGYLDFSVLDYDGSLATSYLLRVHLALQKLQVSVAGGPIMDLMDLNLPVHTQNLFHFIKLVFDPVSHRIERVVFDDTTFSDLSLAQTVAAVLYTPFLLFGITALAGGAADSDLYVDDVIVTYNESI